MELYGRQSSMTAENGGVLFYKLPYYIKEELAMRLDSHGNWKLLAEALNCPLYQIKAFEDRAVYTKEASPSLVFFEQFCNKISVGQFRSACFEIKNISSVEVIDSFFGNFLNCNDASERMDEFDDFSLRKNSCNIVSLNKGMCRNHDSLCGNGDINNSILQNRLEDFNDLCGSSFRKDSCNIVSLSRGICRNRYGCNSTDFSCPRTSSLDKTNINNVQSVSSGNSKDCSFTERLPRASVFLTYFPLEKNNAVLNICKFLKKNNVNVSLDMNVKDVKGKPTEDWIKEKLEAVDYIVVIATPAYKAIVKCQNKWWRNCFQNPQEPNADQMNGYHVPLIHSYMLAEHKKLKQKMASEGVRKKLVVLLPPGSTTKDVPNWLRSSYDYFIWPKQYRAFLVYLLNDISMLHRVAKV